MSDNERLCAMEPCLQLERFQPPVGLRPGTARLADQGLTCYATNAGKREKARKQGHQSHFEQCKINGKSPSHFLLCMYMKM